MFYICSSSTHWILNKGGDERMNWTAAIDRNREALLRLLAILYSAVGLGEGEPASRLPRHVYWNVMRILRSAESAFRRLVVIAARELVLPLPVPRAGPTGAIASSGVERLPCFPLYDRMKRFDRPVNRKWAVAPRLTIVGVTERDGIEEASVKTDQMDAAALCRRLEMLRRALDDLPGQAKRLARRRARDARRRKDNPFCSMRISPMRPGWPPGHRARGGRAVDMILADCDVLARRAEEPADTS